MTKKRWILMLALAVALLTMTAALADGAVTTPSDVYEREENDGHAHWVKCSAPDVCIWCGAKVSTTRQTHEYKSYPYNATHHQVRCAACGEVQGNVEHTAHCDAPNACGACGATGVVIKGVYHNEEMAHDASSHYMQCTRCGKITSTKQAHYALCDGVAGKCERCGASYHGALQHFAGKNAVGHDATYHWFTCEWCGASVREKHYAQHYDWYEYEDETGFTCKGCGIAFQQPASGAAGKKPSDNADTESSFDEDALPAAVIDGPMTAAALHGNTEGLPMALVYAPRTGKATLRATASTNGKELAQLPEGTIVIILGEEGRFTKVSVDERTGYILTDALKMLDPEQLPLGEGMLVYPTTGGRGTTTVNGRSDASSKARIITRWPTGTVVIIWSVSENGKWYEVEYDNMRLYISAEFLAVTQLYDYPEEEPDEPEAVDGEA